VGIPIEARIIRSAYACFADVDPLLVKMFYRSAQSAVDFRDVGFTVFKEVVSYE